MNDIVIIHEDPFEQLGEYAYALMEGCTCAVPSITKTEAGVISYNLALTLAQRYDRELGSEEKDKQPSKASYKEALNRIDAMQEAIVTKGAPLPLHEWLWGATRIVNIWK